VLQFEVMFHLWNIGYTQYTLFHLCSFNIALIKPGAFIPWGDEAEIFIVVILGGK